MPTRVLFMPWPKTAGLSANPGRAEMKAFGLIAEGTADPVKTLQNAATFGTPGQEHGPKNTQWKAAEAGGKHNWYEVWYTSRPSIILATLRSTDQVYVRGHGKAATATLSSGGSEIPVELVADRLIECGLSPAFSGRIKCYNCHSAEGGDRSFSQKFANYMHSKGYKNCAYFGYEGSIDSFRGADPIASGIVGGNHKTTDLGAAGYGRAKAFRTPVIPH